MNEPEKRPDPTPEQEHEQEADAMREIDRKNALHEIPMIIARGDGLGNSYAALLLAENAALKERVAGLVETLNKIGGWCQNRDRGRLGILADNIEVEAAWAVKDPLPILQARLAEERRPLVEAFRDEEEKVQKARDFLLNIKCSCSGEGVGTPGGCDRCRALDYLSTHGWDFRAIIAKHTEG